MLGVRVVLGAPDVSPGPAVVEERSAPCDVLVARLVLLPPPADVVEPSRVVVADAPRRVVAEPGPVVSVAVRDVSDVAASRSAGCSPVVDEPPSPAPAPSARSVVGVTIDVAPPRRTSTSTTPVSAGTSSAAATRAIAVCTMSGTDAGKARGLCAMPST
ncbi:MAG: hypothetical protein R2749_21435 [Acidimicrobiales bacterium]